MTGIDEILIASRVGWPRLTPHEVAAALPRGALLIDTRTENQRRQQGELPGVP